MLGPPPKLSSSPGIPSDPGPFFAYRTKHHASNYRSHRGGRFPTRNRGKALCSAGATVWHRQLNADLAHSRRLPPDRRRAPNQRSLPKQTGGCSAASVLGLRFVLKYAGMCVKQRWRARRSAYDARRLYREVVAATRDREWHPRPRCKSCSSAQERRCAA